ncbi:PLD nuclease N-terminal domain-containing protein [soil metagenome]
MARLYAVLTLVDLAFMIFAFVDVLLTQDWRVRGVPKVVWLIIVVLLSPIGGILWFFVGKEPVDAQAAPPQRRQVAPDDDPDFLARMRLRDEQDERIRKLEQELAELDDEQPDSGDGHAK